MGITCTSVPSRTLCLTLEVTNGDIWWKRLEPKELLWQQHWECHFDFFVMHICAAKFQEHCFSISRNIVYLWPVWFGGLSSFLSVSAQSGKVVKTSGETVSFSGSLRLCRWLSRLRHFLNALKLLKNRQAMQASLVSINFTIFSCKQCNITTSLICIIKNVNISKTKKRYFKKKNAILFYFERPFK